MLKLLALPIFCFSIIAFAQDGDDVQPITVTANTARNIANAINENVSGVIATVSADGTEMTVKSNVELPQAGQEIPFAVQAVNTIQGFIKDKRYGAAIGAILMLLVSIINLLVFRGGEQFKKYIPTVVMISGFLIPVAANLAALAAGATVRDWGFALWQGCQVGAVSIGLYEFIGRHLFKWLGNLLAKKNA